MLITTVLVLYSSSMSYIAPTQGWEFAHRFSERIARFFVKNEQFTQKKPSDSLIRSFLVSDLSDLLMIAHFW